MQKARVDSLVMAYEGRFKDMLSENQRRMFIRGIKLIDLTLKGKGLMLGMPYLTEQLLKQVQEFGATLVTDLTNDAAAKD